MRLLSKLADGAKQLEAKAPHLRETLLPFEQGGFFVYDLRNDYRRLTQPPVISHLP